MAAIQLNFTLRTSANCKTVHLLGSWDNYSGQLPLSKDAAKAGGWKGTFRFQGTTLKPGSRYWYYYIIDGYHVSHDPAREFTTEPTTGRKLNILDIPNGSPAASKRSSAATTTTSTASTHKRHSRKISENVPKGRSLSPSKIQSPRPYKPNQTAHLTQGEFAADTVDDLAQRLASQEISDSPVSSEDESEEESDEEIDSDSDVSSDVPSLTSRSSNSSSPSSVSSGSCCTCERYGITRKGDRVKLDCGGARCGYSDGDSESCESDSERENVTQTARRQGIVVRT